MKHKLTTILSFIILIFIWNIASLKVNPLFVPSPYKVLDDFLILISTKQLYIAIIYSLKRVVIASVLSGIIALPVGLVIYNFRFCKDCFESILSMLRYIPITAFYPLLIMWLGINEEMKIAFLFIAAFVYMMPSVILSLNEIDSQLIDTGLTMGMSKLQTIWFIQIPSSLPSILNSFIMCLGIDFTYLTVCETINAKYGLGYMIHQASSRGKTDLVFVGIISIILISFILDNVSKWLVKKIFKWRYIND